MNKTRKDFWLKQQGSRAIINGAAGEKMFKGKGIGRGSMNHPGGLQVPALKD